MTNFVRFVFVGVFVVGWVCVASAQNVPELLYYKFNETGGTTTENFANPGVGTNPASVIGQTMGGTGQFGSALMGTGVASNYVNTGWNTALGSGSWTISLWLNNLPSSTALSYLWGDNTSSSFRCFLGGAAGAGNITLRGTGITNVDVPAVAPGPTVVHFVYDAALTQIRAYKNGVLSVTVPQTALNLPTGTSPFRVGAYSTSAGLPAAGLMDEFRMYNRALSDAEITATWNQSLPLGTPGWSAQTSGVATSLNTVKAVSSSIVWAGGAGGVVLRTTDGGTTWASVGGGGIGTQDLYAIDAISATTAFVTGTPSTTSYMFRTTNGGTSWDTVYTQAQGFLDAIKMYDATNGIAMGDPVGGKWTIVRTTDGGATWARIATEPTQVGTEAGSNNGMATIGTTHIWFLSNTTPSKAYRSTDAGITWSGVNLPFTATFAAGIAFNNTQNGVVGADGGQAARTTDGGVTWNSVTVGGTGAIYGAAGAGTINFWETRGTTIQKSVNLGAAWSQDFSDAAAGTFNHLSFTTSGNIANGWAVTTTGKIYTYFNPVDARDLGVTSLAKLATPSNKPAPINIVPAHRQSPESAADVISTASTPSDEAAPLQTGPALHTVGDRTVFGLADTVRFRAIIKNFGTLPESTYQIGWSVDGVNQTPVNNPRPLAAGANDTVTFQWNQGTEGQYTARAWTVLAADNNHTNDTASLNFSVGIAPGDTLYTFTTPVELVLGVAKIPSNKLVFTSGGASNTLTTDNRWLVTTLHGTVLDTSHLQINNTAGQGFGFRDLAWDGQWLLTSDNAALRRIDTATYTEVAPQITGPGTLQRGVATETSNRIWKSNFTTDPVVLFDTTGATIKSRGVPTVAPYGIAFDPWTSASRGYLWYSQPSAAGQIRLSKVDTATGAILTTYDYSAMVPATSSSGGLDITNNHPDYPGRVVAFMVVQLGPGAIVMAIDLGRDSSVAAPPATEQRKDHVTSAFRTTVTNEGTIGSLNAFVGTGPGSGFQFNPVTTGGQRLYGDGFMIALDSTRVSDGARNNATPAVYDADFKFLTVIDSVTAGNKTTMTTSYTDSLAETPIGARINQRTVSWDSAGLNNFLIVELDVVNTSATPWTTLHAGGLLDWDVDPATANDRGAVVVDSTNTIPGVNGGNPFAFDMLEMHQGTSPNSWMGVVPLNENRFRGRRIAISSSEIYNPAHVTNGDKWRYMTSNRATNPNGDAGSAVDHAQVFGSGPYSVAAGATKRVGFALFGGTSFADAVAAARAAQRAWVQRLGNTINVTITGVQDPAAGLPEVFELAQNYPNPFNPSTTIKYALPEAAHVTLGIYNVLGQRIAELTNEVESAGFYSTVWNGRNQAGSQVATGVYFYRIEATPASGTAPFVSLKKMVLLK